MTIRNIKYTDILRENSKLAESLTGEKNHIRVLSNIISSQFNEILEYTLRIEGINVVVSSGDYDNIVQDSNKYQDSEVVIIFWELCNIIDGLQYKIELLSNDELNAILEKVKSEINLVLKNLKQTSLVLFNRFTSFQFSCSGIRENNFDKMVHQLNAYLEQIIPENVRLIDLEKVIAVVGVEKALDLRYYYSSKSLYTVDFFKVFAEYIKPLIMSANGKAKKILVFDCDNTLWKGILGEDGFEHIEMSEQTKNGVIFSEIQSIALALTKQGVLIGLCSKNNPADVDEVIKKHPDMQLRDEYITINKTNWSDKVSNLKIIAQELNIGLDSIVFVDDSSFEVNLIKEQLPEVTVLQVPERLYEYPKMLREHSNLFYNLSFTDEDKKKVELYKQQVARETVKNEFGDIEDYLSSLELKMKTYEDDGSIIPRMSQMTQKTNQFNLTTKRYTEGDIKNFVESDGYAVVAIAVSDKFGDNGVTGLCIIKYDDNAKSAEIDTFLLSCRIIGRNIEYAFIDHIVNMIKAKGIVALNAKYIKTPKNEIVKDFYESCTISLVQSSDIENNYTLNISKYNPAMIKYIEVTNA